MLHELNLNPCQQCAETHCDCMHDEDPFLEWIVGILGPVILGAKPSEFLSFTHW